VRPWLTPKPDPDFEAKCIDVCGVYRSAIEAKETTRTVSVDEMTGIQALERIAPALPMQPGKVERREFEYVRHGTQALIAYLDVATGMIGGSVADTRTEADFVAFLETLFATTAPTINWRIVCDNLDIHMSEGVVRLVARQCGIDEAALGRKGRDGVLATRRAGRASCAIKAIASPSTSRPGTPPGSIRSKSGSPSWCASCYAAPISSPRPISSSGSRASSTTSTAPWPSRSSGPGPESR
jgi:hypothetical protein